MAKDLQLYRRLVKFVRLQHLSLEYIANVVNLCPLVSLSGLLPSILQSSLATRDADPELLAEEDIAPLDRGRGGLEWKGTGTFSLTDLLPLMTGKSLYKCIGLVDGYPLRISVAHYSGETYGSAGIFVYMVMPTWTAETRDGRASRCTSFEYNLRVGPIARADFVRLREGEIGRGYPDFFERSLDDVVHEESAYLVDGQLTIEVGMRARRKEDRGK